MLRKTLSLAVGLALASLVSVQSASAAVVLSFDDDAATQNGTISSATGATITGSGIDFVSISATGANGAAPLTCTGCELNFTTGTFTGGNTYGAGGTFTITGSITSLGLTNVVLLSGTFTNATLSSGASSTTLSGFGIDSKNAALLAYFGISPTLFDFASTDIEAGASLTAGTAFNATQVTNADVDNTARIPEPASLLLLGLGLTGVVRRMSKANSRA